MRRRPVRQTVCAGCLVTLVLSWCPQLEAAILYVDNRHGSDTYDGRADRPVDVRSGPVASIGRAADLAGPGDTIVVANTGLPYTGPIALAGAGKGGFSGLPLTIVGNGAVVDGSQPIDPSAWRNVGPGLWRMTPWHKGTYLLLSGDRPLPEHPRPRDLSGVIAMPVRHWTAFRGSVYLRLDPLDVPADLPLRLAAEPMGLSLYKVRHVLVRDLTFKHFQVDGVNLHDLCEHVVLDNVRSLENARAGVTVAGTSTVSLRDCEVAGNGRHSLLITEKAGAEVDAATRLSQPPTVVP